MWPLSIFLSLATAVSLQKPIDLSQDSLQLRLAVVQHSQFDDATGRKLLAESQRNTCYTMRSYFFRRQDGQAPVPAGMSTCIPANITRQLQVSPAPRVMFIPLKARSGDR